MFWKLYWPVITLRMCPLGPNTVQCSLYIMCKTILFGSWYGINCVNSHRIKNSPIKRWGWLYGIEMDSYKSWFLDGRPDGIWNKHKFLRAGVSIRMCMCLIFWVLNIHIPLYLDSRGKPFFPDF